MEICHNCKIKEAEYNCDKCKRAFCKTCDLYIHSFSSKIRHIRRKLFNISQKKQYETARNKYSTDENGLYVYTGNTNRKYNSLYKSPREPLFEKENHNFYSPNSPQSINYYEYLSPKKCNLKLKNKSSSPNPSNINNINNITYNLNSNNKEYDDNKYNENNEIINYNISNNKKINLSPQELSASDELNETNQSLKRTKSFNSTIAKNNLNSFEEKIKLMKKISQLHCELSNTRSDIDQKLDILNNNLHNYNEINKKEMIKLNKKNINEINNISSQKDTLIKHLKDILKDQEETIQKLLKKKKNLEADINENKYLIEKYTKEKNNYIKEKENNETLYNEKKNMLQERHEREIEKIRNDYDNELGRLSTKYIQTKSEYLNEIKKGNEIIEEYKIKGQKEVELISNEIDKLQNINDIKNKEQEEAINNNNELKKSLEDFQGRFDEINLKHKTSNDERERILKIYNDAQNEVKRRKKENTKLHDLKYGRFFGNSN